HGLQDTYAVRVGGSWSFPIGGDALIARGGVSYDTAAAMSGWERADLDGAARTMLAAGASYKMKKIRFDAGFGVILEGTRPQNRTCVPTGAPMSQGCGPDGTQQPVPGFRQSTDTLPNRQGPDPISPIFEPASQLEAPVNEGTFKSHYLMFMLGASY